ncbi:MAG: YhfC family glutamic-type intramembrane protease [Candidatus ainarchaeum sp.]|nr:YhfC family glutamic-type intramembrane protease [Candidatus ainarchaeum sp.]
MNPLVILSFAIAVLVEICVPLIIGYWLVKRFKVPWKLFGLGVLFFIIVQILHTPFVVLAQTPFSQWVQSIAPDKIFLLAGISIFLGLMAGLFEEVGRFLVFKYFFKRQKIDLKKENAFLFGAGWGGIESIAVGIILLLTMFSYMVAAPLTGQNIADINAAYGGQLTQEQVDAITKQNEALINLSPFDTFVGMFERLMTFAIQIAFTLMVFASVVTSKKKWLIIAIIFHTVLDALAVFTGQLYGVLIAEVIVFICAVIALLYIKKEWPGLAKAQAKGKWAA